jgi:hypothetical protein
MRVLRFIIVWSVSTCLGCNKAPDLQARADLALVLRDSIRQAADPQVAFLDNHNHLLVHMDAKPFAGVSDSAFSVEARRIGQLAMRNYRGSQRIDSVTVETRVMAVPNQAMRVIKSRIFSAAELGRSGTE